MKDEATLAWHKQYLRQLYREALDWYRNPTSEWAKHWSHQRCSYLWEEYRATRKANG